jgi:AcrR family transcriptional regulator
VTGAPHESKASLLRDAMAYVAEHGVGDLSLRRLAAEIGTSHRMLIYHFGSKEGLFIEVIRAVEEQQRATLAGLEVDPAMTAAEMTRTVWRHLSDPALAPNERLFYEVYGQALQARPQTANFLDDIVESWLGQASGVRVAQGVPAEHARAQARLDVAMTRGLLLDLLATGERAEADAAVEQYIALFEAWRAAQRDHDPRADTRAARTATQSIETDADPPAAIPSTSPRSPTTSSPRSRRC